MRSVTVAWSSIRYNREFWNRSLMGIHKGMYSDNVLR
jgi:hypothetical protein